jgi:hypothetical protein
VHDPEESDEDQCGHSHGDGCPDAKFCHDVRVLPGALTLRERDVMRRLVEVTGASRARILRRSPPRGPIEPVDSDDRRQALAGQAPVIGVVELEP